VIEKLTEAQKKACQILRDHGPIRPREFAQKMWPDSPAWRHSCRCGPNGAHRGGGMYLAGGGYLGRLVHLGLAKYTGEFRYILSPLGQQLLQSA